MTPGPVLDEAPCDQCGAMTQLPDGLDLAGLLEQHEAGQAFVCAPCSMRLPRNRAERRSARR